MPPGTQSKILRVLVDQAFQRVGGADTVRVDVRVISATTRDLAREVAGGAVPHRALPPAERGAGRACPASRRGARTSPSWRGTFLEELNASQGLPPRALAPEAEAQLQTMRWPGNVRQLRNTLERALILGPDHGPIEPEELVLDAPPNGAAANGMLGAAFAGLALREAREMFEREYLMAQINRFGGNISRTASFVGMERSALAPQAQVAERHPAGRSERAEEAEAHA